MRVAVTVDDREPAGLVEAVRDHPDVTEVVVDRLSTGDLAIDSVGIERKTLRDYVNSAMGRSGSDLTDQVERMAAAYDHSYVLLEGDFADLATLRTAVSPESVRGSMASITARHEVPVVPCTDRAHLVDYAIRLGRKHVEEPSSRRLPVGSVPSRREPTTKRMYGCIEGIGPELAATLYERYPTVESLLEASLEELTEIEGIGERRARTIDAAFREDGRPE
ncbi:ERCC4 domain protein [Haloterrigena turkmenica DSM 5511]|uniref:ERCC4 domain protein n=1 Tax=Haloterrigena turkmenica (strain ATCC 51198 / DSM 5511 / JCM 9101 / NCIMB 13204 / VKM B-1734 / 4k) TaxID=543526 RepID=D2RXG2_HALTV|nr:ERCC4 domain-containing protein [Haloterrigena turkmenica]ADB61686.1 ERCC4 domain protein [Haloterrigena turkmenica DSM 5511]